MKHTLAFLLVTFGTIWRFKFNCLLGCTEQKGETNCTQISTFQSKRDIKKQLFKMLWFFYLHIILMKQSSKIRKMGKNRLRLPWLRCCRWSYQMFLYIVKLLSTLTLVMRQTFNRASSSGPILLWSDDNCPILERFLQQNAECWHGIPLHDGINLQLQPFSTGYHESLIGLGLSQQVNGLDESQVPQATLKLEKGKSLDES